MLNITITLTRYKEPNWLVNQTLDSLANQNNIKATILFLDQFENIQIKKYCTKLSKFIV